MPFSFANQSNKFAWQMTAAQKMDRILLSLFLTQSTGGLLISTECPFSPKAVGT
jgi:hypothetical protein